MTEGKYRLDLDKIPITLATLSQMEVMCGFHERFSWIIIPRNLCSCTHTIGVLFIKIFNYEGLICLRRGWKMMNLDLSGWTVSLFALNQEETWESSWLTILAKVAKSLLVSSAKRINERKFEERKRSLMYKRNNKGPRS